MNTLAKPIVTPIAKSTTKLISNVPVKTSHKINPKQAPQLTPQSAPRQVPQSAPGPGQQLTPQSAIRPIAAIPGLKSNTPGPRSARNPIPVQATSMPPVAAIVHNKSFTRTAFWVTIGKSTDGIHCCVCVEKKQSSTVLYPVNDRKYIATNVFQFDAGNKIVLSCIMTNLHSMGIWPNGKECNFNPPFNPDNIFYTSLLISDMPLIANTIRSTIAGITIGVGIGIELVVPELDLALLIQSESPNILLEHPCAYIIRPHGNNPDIVVHSIGKNRQDIMPSR